MDRARLGIRAAAVDLCRFGTRSIDRKRRRTTGPAGCPLRNLLRVESRHLSIREPRYWWTDRRKPARVLVGHCLLLLALPFGLTQRKESGARIAGLAWLIFAAESILCVLLGRGDVSHRALAQWLSLGSVLVWIPLIPAYYSAFRWHAETKRWRVAFLWWWGGLALTGWIFFLPGVLDRFKFTDGLVGHSLTAVAGCLTAFVIFAMVQLVGVREAWIFNRQWSFYAWNLGVLAYVIVMTVAGWIEGADPSFTIVPGFERNLLYTLRLFTGLAMLAGSVEWLVAASTKSATARKPEIESTEAKVA